MADVLFGKATPSGKLPVTFPKSIEQLPPFTDYAMQERTYRYATWEPLYPFGFGLSYTSFAYSNLRLEGNLAYGTLTARVLLTNTGATVGEEVVQVYLSDVEASVVVPYHRLIAFRRVELAPGESRELTFEITPDMLALVDEAGASRLEAGDFRLTIGGCSPGARGIALGAPEPVSATFTLQFPKEF
ncbi:MAG: Periplasmic beta-glucosidase precursor [Chloroflexi bacterium ADurb.Bin360]|nr:MAG: Periplasmic beta-glucosidase precursor [Chloroflexi bacterium ADurb.Bin360]